MTQTPQPSDFPLLSVAIPTYNRAKYLDQLLEVLFQQLRGENGVELIVSDNASTDNTPAIVEGYRQQGLPIRYLRNLRNEGPDVNILQCYESANGKYVWILGDDDLILEGGLSRVLALLEDEELDFVFLAPYVFHDTIAEIRYRTRAVPTQITEEAPRLAYLADLHSDLVFISAGIVNKSRVSKLPHPPFSSLLGTNLVQLGWVMTAIRHFRRGAFVQLGVLAGRAGNSSGGFQAAAVFGENYRNALYDWLGDSRLTSRLLREHLLTWFPRNWLQFRTNEIDQPTYDKLRAAFRGHTWIWMLVYPLFKAPAGIARYWARILQLISRIQMLREPKARI